MACLQLAVGCSARPTTAAPTRSADATPSVESTASTTTEALCTEFVLRMAEDDRGARPLLMVDGVNPDQFEYDALAVHHCRAGWALVEASHSSGSAFSFWLLKEDSGEWALLGATAVRLDTPVKEPLFTSPQLVEMGVDPTDVTAAFGSTTTSAGRLIFQP